MYTPMGSGRYNWEVQLGGTPGRYNWEVPMGLGRSYLRVCWEDHEDVVQCLGLVWVIDRDKQPHRCSKLSEGRGKVGGVTGVGEEYTSSNI